MNKDSTKKNQDDLNKELNEKRISLRDIRFGVAGSKGKNVKEYRNIKKEIAKIKTVLSVKD